MSDNIYGGKKVLIITGYTDAGRSENSSNASHEELFELTLPSKQRYAKKQGYDLLTMRSFGDASPYGLSENDISKASNKYTGFLRAIVAFEMLFAYETVFWIDADSIITNYDYELSTFGINSKKTFYASYDWLWKTSFSTGNFIVHRTPMWREFFQFFMMIKQNFKNHSCEEQATLNFIYDRTKMSETMQVLDHKYLGGVPKELENTNSWHDRPRINWPWDESCFLAHFTGLPNNERIGIIKNNFFQYI